MQKKIVLVAVIGTSPAVLTETVWALAHLEQPVVPDEVVVITTQSGAMAIRNQLFGEANGWGRLLAALKREKIDTQGRLLFGDTQHSIRLLSDRQRQRELADIATTEDNAQAADDILEILRGFTEDPATRVYASLAGGRKTMGALLLSCMSLLGREDDHVLHVLVNAPFDGGVEPPFLFPERGVRYTPRSGGGPLTAKAANVTLIDLPFVKMRGWYQEKFRTLPPSYSHLVAAVQSTAPEADVAPPVLTFDLLRGTVHADGVDLKLSRTEFIALAVDLLLAPPDLRGALGALHARAGRATTLPWLCEFGESSRFAREDSLPDDLTKTRNSLRDKLRAVPALAGRISQIVPRGAKNGDYPKGRISADIKKFVTLTGF